MGQATQTYANITRQMYQDWYTHYYPMQQSLLQYAKEGALAKEQLGRVDQHYQDAYHASEQSYANHLGRYGVTPSRSPHQKARQALASVATHNAIRDYERDRSRQILSGSGMGLRQAIKVGGG
ncbi:TPA: hypothetical protein ACX6Q7_002020 [Photobacterium damselae]